MFLPAHLDTSIFSPFYIGYGHNHLQRLLLLVYAATAAEIYLPAYLNNIMNKYKVTMH